LARRYVERSGSPWFILSAKHGLLHPATQIAPYDETLKGKNSAALRRWAELVGPQILASVPHDDEIVVLAGEDYRKYLEPILRQHFAAVQVPMAGLRIGEQLRWLKHGQA
jgi:hypothetical protein